MLECGLSGANSAPEATIALDESAKVAAPEAVAQDLPVRGQSEGTVATEMPRPQGFACGQVTENLEATLVRRPELRRSAPELPEKEQEQEGPEQREQLSGAPTIAALPAAIEFQSVPEFAISPVPEQTLPEPRVSVDTLPAELGQPLRPARKDPDLAFRLLLRPEQPVQCGETAPAEFPQDERTTAATRTPVAPENTFEPHETEIPAPAGVTPKKPERPPRPETPEIVREAVPAPKRVAAEGGSRGVSAEAAETARGPINEVRFPDFRATRSESETRPPQEQRGIPPAQPSRLHGMAAPHESGAPPKDKSGTAPPASRADQTLPSQDQAMQPASAKHVFVRVDRAGARPVDIGLVEKAGRVEVSVRSADDGLNRALRENLGDLVLRLREEGFEAASWTPREAYGTERTEWTANERSTAGERESARERFEQPGEQRQRKRPAEPWLEVLDAESEKQGGKR